MAFPIRYLNQEYICGEADHFQNQHNPDGGIPVPIKEIIEFQLKMDIIPFRGLQDQFDIAGFLLDLLPVNRLLFLLLDAAERSAQTFWDGAHWNYMVQSDLARQDLINQGLWDAATCVWL